MHKNVTSTLHPTFKNYPLSTPNASRLNGLSHLPRISSSTRPDSYKTSWRYISHVFTYVLAYTELGYYRRVTEDFLRFSRRLSFAQE